MFPWRPRALAGRGLRLRSVFVAAAMIINSLFAIQATADAPSSSELREWVRNNEEGGQSPAGTNPTTAPAISGTPDGLSMTRVVASLAIVVALILVLRWTARRFFSVPGAGSSGQAIRVLSRTTITPRQQLMLLQVGRRLVLVSSSGTAMSTLCEITDAQEVAELTAQLRSGGKSSPAGTFGSIFGGASRRFSGVQDGDDIESEPVGDEQGPSRTGPAVGAAKGEPDVGATRKEVTDLMDKVRVMSKRFQG